MGWYAKKSRLNLDFFLEPRLFFHHQKNPTKAHAIKDNGRSILKKQKEQLVNSRIIKNKEQIEKVMRFIDAKLEFNKPKYQFNTHQFNQKIDLQFYKLELIKCELCSWT